MNISAEIALELLKESGGHFTSLFTHGTLSIEIYKPDKIDHQEPHDKDELYVIISGSGNFSCDGKRSAFVKGDLLFVPAGAEHRFEDFTEDFSTWVIFYGPKGGEAAV